MGWSKKMSKSKGREPRNHPELLEERNFFALITKELEAAKIIDSDG